MPPDIALELWTKILAFLPYTSLNAAKHVNRVFYQICRALIFRVLDLIPVFTDDNMDEQLGVFKKRLSLAKRYPRLIKTVRFMSVDQLPLYYAPKQSQAKPIPFLKRVFAKAERTLFPVIRSSTHPEYPIVWEVESTLLSLLPSFTLLEELDMGHPSMWLNPWTTSTSHAVSLVASRITVLAIQLPFSGMPYIALPALHTLRLMSHIAPSNDHDSIFGSLISSSPLLREIQYHFLSYNSDVIFFTPSVEAPKTYSHLKVFKWTGIKQSPGLHLTNQSNALSISLPSYFMSHSSQFEVVHLNPAPSFDSLRALEIGQLVELRVDLNCRDDGANLFTLLEYGGQLEVLEITGMNYRAAADDPANLFPESGLGQLKRLFLGDSLKLFGPQSLIALAPKIPRLQRLAILVEPLDNDIWTRKSVQAKCEMLVDDFRFTPSNVFLSEWKVLDFGIIVRDWPGKIVDLKELLIAICRKVPSIQSFYGTGSLRLWAGMDDEIDKRWGGELWNQRRGNW
ncbi:hypothetical protein DL96DRAFT_1635820 [Flagelloscypha sp. PMI_526]|nr:hypothetical protein DL96DRAFT_1635820 [Flagelloscypha sp. PMI_526]